MKKVFLFISLFVSAFVWANEPVLRGYNKPQGGFVILDENDEIVGFSESGTLSENENPFVNIYGESAPLLQVMREQLPEEYVPVWPAPVEDSIGPLLDNIRYNQGRPYNLMTPTYAGQHCVTGCVATAMAQIMRYWQWPDVCNNGTETYYVDKIKQDVSFTYDNVAFDWEHMKPVYSNLASEETQQEWDAVALLMRACGVGVHMGYGVDGSGSSSTNVVKPMIQYFKYKSSMRLEGVDNLMKKNEFITGLIDEFKAKRPVYCDGFENGKTGEDAFHAYVIDGFITLKGDKNLDVPYFHFNFGWGGSMNGWYRLTGNVERSIYSTLNIIRFIEPDNGTGLEEVRAEYKDGKIRDIMGREVSETIPGQLYILNGEKFIAR